jgi:hypothetical protein
MVNKPNPPERQKTREEKVSKASFSPTNCSPIYSPLQFAKLAIHVIMYETKDLIFLQMQKAGSTHIAKLLSEIFRGPAPNEGKGKHSRATEAQINSGRMIASSIRSPWDWYVSLWTFGCSGKGGLRHRVTNTKENGSQSSRESWKTVYSDKGNIAHFRQWLHMIFSSENTSLIREGHDMDVDCGFMTYRYIRLCWREQRNQQRASNETGTESLLQQDKERCYVDYFIKAESLEDELCRVINMIRPLTTEEQNLIYRAERTNASSRVHLVREYYDRETIKKVQLNDSLIINKFEYDTPC